MGIMCRRSLSLSDCPAIISIIILFVSLSIISVCPEGAYSVSASLANDSCAIYDSCNVSDFFRTCSCQDDCNSYGTCCSDSPYFDATNSGEEDRNDFHCLAQRLPQPVFFRKNCLPSYSGDSQVKESCENPNSTMSDLMRSVPVSSNKTKITYWNWNCAICNDEHKSDLYFWTVQLSCHIEKSQKRYDVDVYRNNLLYEEEEDAWGISVDSKFKKCPVNFFQPPFLTGQLRYCAPNIIGDCPESWTDDDVRSKCRVIHGERKRKGTDVYYKSVYCAMCNEIPIKDLECFGRTYKTYPPPGDMNIMKMIFNLNPSIRDHVKVDLFCVNGKSYDPFLRECRNLDCGIADSKDIHRNICPYSTSSAKSLSSSILCVVISIILTKLSVV